MNVKEEFNSFGFYIKEYGMYNWKLRFKKKIALSMAILTILSSPINTATIYANDKTEQINTTNEDNQNNQEVTFDHFFNSSISTTTIKSKDFSSCELLAASNENIFTENTEVVSEYNGVYLLHFESEEEAMYAYSYYYDKVDIDEIDVFVKTAVHVEV